MDEQSIRLRCLELAIDRANKEQPVDFRQAVADLQDWFYNRIIGKVEVPKSETLHLPTAKDKPSVAPRK